MNILLDTNVLLWVLSRRANIGDRAAAELESAENDIFFSAVSIWEIAIKYRLSQPDFASHPDQVLGMALAAEFRELPIMGSVAATVTVLPWHHRDPFDRLLIAQAIAMPARLYSSDRRLAAYSELVTLVR